MAKNDELRYGAPGENAVHICVDMQRMFAESTDWKMPWLPRVFALFIAASIAWIADGIFEPKNWLIIQNAVLLVINLLGVWRWLPRAGKEAAAPRPADRAAR
ncbi:hypothetical protein M2175_007023 [Bradyrhizobium elkanii]|uniref:hypothetical protein n=1 Tax=Bradyrhizobium TaxID=374 RepID=UPI002167AB50|nr:MULTISPECIES: hypothetical protein [Bradyrhizobium]MCS3931992.1 hypothetical protein [Bradyrhizobium elkanii]MCS3972550.1 hypothetical protein [Bradyrhizobium japonicum]